MSQSTTTTIILQKHESKGDLVPPICKLSFSKDIYNCMCYFSLLLLDQNACNIEYKFVKNPNMKSSPNRDCN